jgi:predicted permease
MRQHVRYAVRMLWRSPSFTVASIICLALGIGATTAVFSVVYAVLMKPLPYSDSNRLVRIYSEFPKFPGGGLRKFWLSPPEFFDLRREATLWESIDAWADTGVNLAGESMPIRVTACNLSGGLMPALGVKPLMGRVVDREDDLQGKLVAGVISYGLWQSAFAGDAGIVGRNTKLNGLPMRIVGVMPKGFQFPPGEVDVPDLWIPLQLDPSSPANRGGHNLSIVGKVKAGVPIEPAQQELAQLVNAWSAAQTQKVHKFDPAVHPLVSFGFQQDLVGSVRPAMLTLLASVAFVLLIACVNVANLLLARAEARQREIAVRKALGAADKTLMLQFLVEGTILSLAGAVVGVALAYGGLRLLIRVSNGGIPRVNEISVDWRVLLFTLVVSVASGVFFALAPMLQALHGRLSDALKTAAGRSTATEEANLLRRAMVVAEVALALVLLIGTGLMVRAFWKLQAVDAGLNPHGLLTMRLSLPRAVYPDGAQLQQFWTALQQRAASIPGVASATVFAGMPPMRPVNSNDTAIEGFVQRANGPIQNVDYYQAVGRSFFETVGARIIEGRTFDERDGTGGNPSVIVNVTMAKTFWPGQSAIGHRIKTGGDKDWRTIVGVVADLKNGGLDKPTGTELFLPQDQSPIRNGYVVLRTAGNPLDFARQVRQEIAQLDPSVPVAQVRTMDHVMQASQSRPRFLTLLLSIFSGVALILAGVGIYGVISYSVQQRVNEFGIRMALGAAPGSVLSMVIKQGVMLGLAGIAIGTLGALWLTRFIQGLLFGIDPVDAVTFTMMAGVLLAVTLMACYVPALRATRLDPLVALRYE